MAKQTNTTEATPHKKSFVGIVAKKSGDKTVSVKVERFVKHPKYQKFFRSTKKYAAHDEANTANVGDKVVITESRPLSKTKHFEVSEITSQGAEATN